MKRPFLTVLTTPVANDAARHYARLRRAARRVLKPHVPLPTASPYPGHYAVVRSVVEGLSRIGADFNFNPGSLSAIGEAVYAPANEALRQAFELKRRGRIRLLVAGPTNAFLPNECDDILLAPEIDVLIVASEWVKDLFTSAAPSTTEKIRVCQAGVDLEFWQPDPTERHRRAVVYSKDAPETLCDNVERVLTAIGVEQIRVRYGAYDLPTYKGALSESAMAVFLSTFETQGIALAEAWAMNVPTLVWNPQAPTQWRGQGFVAGSSCPFLTPATGRAWKTLDELDARARDVLAFPDRFRPRVWMESHMTDAICATELYRMIETAAQGR